MHHSILAPDRMFDLRGRIYASALRVAAKVSIPEAIALGERTLVDDPRAVIALARLHQRAGAIRRPLALLEGLPTARQPAALVRQLRAELDTLSGPLPAPAPRAAPAWDGGRRVLYHVAQSLPHHVTGYAIRTQGLVSGLRARGWELEVHGRFGYPIDGDDFAGRTVAGEATIDGVPYRFAPDPRRGPRELAAFFEASTTSLIDRARALRPALVHSASNHVVGIAGAEAARRLGLPSIYEVRGLWHLTRAAAEPWYLGSDHFGFVEQLEARAAAAADRVLAITGAVADRLADRGVPRAKISILPNAVDTDRFAPRPRDEALAAQLRLGDRPVIGYVGSFLGYEGLDDLLTAATILRAQGVRFVVLLVGDGAAHADVAARARALGDAVILPGRVPPDEVPRYYSVIDVLAFPRKGLPVCEAVSPLKPLEAMAMARPIVVSSVAPLVEIVEHERTGLVHRKDDSHSLAEQLARCLANPGWARELGERGATWARAHRSWREVTAVVESVYRDLLRA